MMRARGLLFLLSLFSFAPPSQQQLHILPNDAQTAPLSAKSLPVGQLWIEAIKKNMLSRWQETFKSCKATKDERLSIYDVGWVFDDILTQQNKGDTWHFCWLIVINLS